MKRTESALTALQGFLNKATSSIDSSPPVFRVFFSSWLVFNWRGVYYVIFSDDAVTQKLQRVEVFYSSVEQNLLYPLLVTVIYLTVFPIIKNVFIFLWNYVDRKSGRHLLASMTRKVFLTEDEQAEHIQQVEGMLAERDEVIEDLRQQLRSSKALNKKLTHQVSDEVEASDSSSATDISQVKDDRDKPSTDEEQYYTTTQFTNFINSTDGNYQLLKHIAPKLLLDIDDSTHKKELDGFLLITKKVISEFPTNWVAKELLIGNTRYSTSALRSLLKKMESAGLLTLSTENGVPAAKASQELIQFISEQMRSPED